jgi:hypothetical protein
MDKAEVAGGKHGPVSVVEAKYELENEGAEAVEKVFGPTFLKSKFLTRTKNYDRA